MKIAITGHRDIEKSLGYSAHDNQGQSYNVEAFRHASHVMYKFIHDIRSRHEHVTFGSGMARGWDEILALVAIALNVDLELFVPANIQWHQHRALSGGSRPQAIHYQDILDKVSLDKVHEIPKSYGTGHMFANFARNQAMIDWSNEIYSFKYFKSTGTDHAIRSAKVCNKYKGNIAY